MGAINNVKFLNRSKFPVMTSYLVNFGDGTVNGAYIILIIPSLLSSKLLTSLQLGNIDHLLAGIAKKKAKDGD